MIMDVKVESSISLVIMAFHSGHGTNDMESVKIIDKAVCISIHTKVLEQDMNPSVLPQLLENSWADWVTEPLLGNQSRRRKTQNSNQLYFA